MATKRVRNKNFTEKEKCMLMESIHPHKNIIENIKTDSINIRKKNQSREDITQQYNRNGAETGNRTVAQLKNFYDMAKRRAKKELSYDKVSMYKSMKDITDEEQSVIVDLVQSYRSEMVERYKTGGGKYSTTMSGASEQVLGIIGDRIEPLVNPYDDDISYTELMENTTNNCKNIQEDYDNMDSVEVVTLDNHMDVFNVL
ncbi:hypothetical protein ACI65C_006840 [Semiaphis heraclei]